MGTLSHTIMSAVFVDSLEDALRFLTYSFYKSPNARIYSIFYVTLCNNVFYLLISSHAFVLWHIACQAWKMRARDYIIEI